MYSPTPPHVAGNSHRPSRAQDVFDKHSLFWYDNIPSPQALRRQLLLVETDGERQMTSLTTQLQAVQSALEVGTELDTVGQPE